MIKELERKIDAMLQRGTDALNNSSEKLFEFVAGPIVNALAEAEPINENINKAMIFVGAFAFGLAIYINFAL